MTYSPPLQRLIETFQRLPGIGPKSAQRMAFHVLKQPREWVTSFASAMVEAKDQIRPCGVCFNLSNQSPCEICMNTNRNRTVLCVVAEPGDLFALERVGEFQGLYHVLGGLVSPMDGIGPGDLKIQALVDRLSSTQETPIQEVILALPPSTEGDTTSLYLDKLLKPLPLKMTRIAFGLPVGGDLEYADSLTLRRALQGRQVLS